MADLTPTYTFEGDEVFAIHEGKVIASGDDMAKVESDATKYLESLKTTRDQVAKDKAKKSATHVITPNGVKGEIMGRTPDIWGEQVTVRLANGTITQYQIHGESDVEWVTERTASAANPAEKLEQRLAADYEHDRPSLTKRLAELRDIAVQSHHHIASGAPYEIQVRLDQLKVAAEHEASEVKQALDHLEAVDAEAIQAPEWKPQAVEQADMGTGAGNSWLDVTAQEMIDESADTDFEKVLLEGPGQFVTDLDNGALGDAGVTREMAFSHITAKTAGFIGPEVDDFREKFAARVEVARRSELAARKTTIKREAAAEQEAQDDAPDDALFL